MSAFLWFRSWHGAPMDNKWPVIAARSGVKVGIVSAIAWALMDYASQHEPRGTVDGFDTEVYAVYSGFPEAEIDAVIQVMNDKGIIVDGMLANWEKRQPKREDDSKDRVTKFREMKRNVTQCNAEKEDETIFSLSPSLSLSDSLSENSNESILTPDAFDFLQEVFLSSGIMPAGESDIKAINKMVETGIIPEDIKAGLEWKAKNNGGKPVRYVSQLVGPSNTAMSKRMQSNIQTGAPEIR